MWWKCVERVVWNGRLSVCGVERVGCVVWRGWWCVETLERVVVCGEGEVWEVHRSRGPDLPNFPFPQTKR